MKLSNAQVEALAKKAEEQLIKENTNIKKLAYEKYLKDPKVKKIVTDTVKLLDDIVKNPLLKNTILENNWSFKGYSDKSITAKRSFVESKMFEQNYISPPRKGLSEIMRDITLASIDAKDLAELAKKLSYKF
jgi:hypothetical protein